MTTIAIYRHITIQRAEVPGAPITWMDDEPGALGIVWPSGTSTEADDLVAAKRQICAYLGSVDPDCPHCGGAGVISYGSFCSFTDPCEICNAAFSGAFGGDV